MTQSIKVIRNNNETATRWNAPHVEATVGDANSLLSLLTAEQVGQIQDNAFREAREQGYAEGYRLGQEKAQQEIAEKAQELQARITQLDSLLRTLGKPYEQLDEQIEHELFQLAVSLARHLVRRELKAEPGQIVAIVREAVALLPGAVREPRVFLHPEDAAFIREVFSLHGNGEHWKLVDDPSLQRGDCRVVTENSRIDATLENRFAAIVATTLGGERETDAADPR